MAVGLKDRKQIKLGGFKGVDFSSSPLLVSQSRAVSSSNFIYENGVNRKRHGWVEKFRIGTGNINGIFECSIGGEKVLIVYAEKNFYRVTKNNNGEYVSTNITNSSSNQNCKVDVNRLKNQRCQMFINNNRLYFIGMGDFLTYGEYINGNTTQYELRRVEDDDNTHIPTTTINIDADGSNNDIVDTLEAPNLLCSKRKNTFVGNDANSVFSVDSGEIDINTTIKIEHETLDGNGNLTTKTYTNSGSDKTNLYDGSNIVGTVNYATGKITMTIATNPIQDGDANLVVTFSCVVEGYADRINNSEIGVMFGVNGNPDRLFVTGNEEFPNIDFYSEMNDLTYFGDLNYSAIGSSDSRIVGYSRLGDGTLATHKEEVNGEASVYYRTGSYNTEYNSDGSLSSVVAYFPIQAGTIGEGMISRYANANLSGDKIFLSKNGVYGIVLSSNISSTERYSRERSQYISEKLREHEDLSEAVGIAFENKYYLAVDDVCYIADARMTSQNTSDTNSFNYEWYYWENMPVRVWASVGGELFFGTRDGRVCTFDTEYTDRVFEHTESGDLLIDFDTNRITFNQNLSLKKNSVIKFSSDVFMAKLLPEMIVKVENNRVFLNEEDILLFYNSTEVYADNVGSSGLIVNKKYYIDDVNLNECSFRLVDENDDQATILNKNFRLCINIKEKELLISNIQVDATFQIQFTKTDTPIILVKYNNDLSTQTPIADIVIKSPVVAVWKSPVFDFGTNYSMKTLLSLTISTEPTTSGEISFGYTAKDSEESIDAQGINMFDFETLDFNNFTFDSSFANSYTVDIKDYFNFIQFFFKSDNEYACVVHSLTITYKINSTNKGVQ